MHAADCTGFTNMLRVWQDVRKLALQFLNLNPTGSWRALTQGDIAAASMINVT